MIDIDELVTDIKRVRGEVYRVANLGHYPHHIKIELEILCTMAHDLTEKYKAIQRGMK